MPPTGKIPHFRKIALNNYYTKVILLMDRNLTHGKLYLKFLVDIFTEGWQLCINYKSIIVHDNRSKGMR